MTVFERLDALPASPEERQFLDSVRAMAREIAPRSATPSTCRR
jgi:hypothetical protein